MIDIISLENAVQLSVVLTISCFSKLLTRWCWIFVVFILAEKFIMPPPLTVGERIEVGKILTRFWQSHVYRSGLLRDENRTI